MDRDPALEQELSNLNEGQRQWVEEQLALRAKAERLAQRLDLDPNDVFHILRHLDDSSASLSPAEMAFLAALEAKGVRISWWA
jgi:hypothetical protein